MPELFFLVDALGLGIGPLPAYLLFFVFLFLLLPTLYTLCFRVGLCIYYISEKLVLLSLHFLDQDVFAEIT
jgi:hypothetical protein